MTEPRIPQPYGPPVAERGLPRAPGTNARGGAVLWTSGRIRPASRSCRTGIAYRKRLRDAAVTPSATPTDKRVALGGLAPEHPTDATTVIRSMADIVEAGGLMAIDSGRFFGFGAIGRWAAAARSNPGE